MMAMQSAANTDAWINRSLLLFLDCDDFSRLANRRKPIFRSRGEVQDTTVDYDCINDISYLGSYWSLSYIDLLIDNWAHFQRTLCTSCIIPQISDTLCASWRSQSWAQYLFTTLCLWFSLSSAVRSLVCSPRTWSSHFSVFSSVISLNYYFLFFLMLSYGVVSLLALATVSSAGPISPARRDSS